MSLPSPSARSPTTLATPSVTRRPPTLPSPSSSLSSSAKYGPLVNYAEGRHQHVQTEFAFDIDEIAHHRVAPVHYLRHIGLKVPVRQLGHRVLPDLRRHGGFHRQRSAASTSAIIASRFAPLSRVSPTRSPCSIATTSPPRPQPPSASRWTRKPPRWPRKQLAGLSPKCRHRHLVLAGLLFILPKFGPLKLVAIKGPTRPPKPTTCTASCLSAPLFAGDWPASPRHLLLATRTPSPDAPSLRAAIPPAAEIAHPSRDPLHPLPNRDLDTGYVVNPAAIRSPTRPTPIYCTALPGPPIIPFLPASSRTSRPTTPTPTRPSRQRRTLRMGASAGRPADTRHPCPPAPNPCLIPPTETMPTVPNSSSIGALAFSANASWAPLLTPQSPAHPPGRS